MAAFVAFSWYEFGELLPPYYRLGLEGGAFSAEALAGLLVSPSRGLLLFSPLLLAAWAARPLARRDWPLAHGVVAGGTRVARAARCSRSHGGRCGGAVAATARDC